MWHSYFHRIENKYQMRISLKRELVIRVDGRNITKSRNFSLLEKKENSFLDCFEKTIKTFTQRHNCLCFCGADEASFIFDNPTLLLDNLNIDKEKNARTNDIVALFTQEFFNSFNNLYNVDEKIFWHGMCFSIEKEKINSYIKFRSAIVKNVMTTYFLKRMMINNAGKIKMEERIAKNEKYNAYEKVKQAEKGKLYLNGDRIDKEEFLKGNIVKLDEEKEKIEEDYFDITKWDMEE